jgi:hypothetical protein
MCYPTSCYVRMSTMYCQARPQSKPQRYQLLVLTLHKFQRLSNHSLLLPLPPALPRTLCSRYAAMALRFVSSACLASCSAQNSDSARPVSVPSSLVGGPTFECPVQYDGKMDVLVLAGACLGNQMFS